MHPQPEHFEKVRGVVVDLYPEYRGWTVRAISDTIDYIPPMADENEQPNLSCQLPDGCIAVILARICVDEHTEEEKHAAVIIPSHILEEPKRDGPRISLKDLAERIASVRYHAEAGTNTTVCYITLDNGMTFTGKSSCISRRNFDWDMGKAIAYNNAQDAAMAGLAMIKADEMLAAAKDYASSQGVTA